MRKSSTLSAPPTDGFATRRASKAESVSTPWPDIPCIFRSIKRSRIPRNSDAYFCGAFLKFFIFPCSSQSSTSAETYTFLYIYRLIKRSYRIITPCLEKSAFQSLWKFANLKAISVFDSQLIPPPPPPPPPPQKKKKKKKKTHTHSHICCMMVPNHCLHQCQRIIINGLLLHSPQIIFKWRAHEINS